VQEKIMVRCSYELRERIKEKAYRRDMSMNALVVQVLNDLVDGRLMLADRKGERIWLWGVGRDPARWAAERIESARRRAGQKNFLEDLDGDAQDSDCKASGAVIIIGQ
jgi:hypothetical protein